METQSFFYKGYTRAILTLLVISAIVALVAYTNLTLQEARYLHSGPTTINVTGEGEVFAIPDVGQFSFSVNAEGVDATEAQTKSAESINAVIAYLTQNGVEERDIKTQNYNLYPNYRYEERACPQGGFCPPGERVLDGFSVNQTVMVKVRDTEKAGELISGVGERGATNISGLDFTTDDQEELLAEAREAAIKDAKQKAKELARDLDVSIVRMVGYWEDQGGYPEPMFARAEMAMDESASIAIAPSLPTGEDRITSRVNISYEVR